ncbi:NAD(P)-dependent alcohol dehydrogenase [Labedella phragmitis]|nr:NAD(P)-dependent alcohol dehydrogenase [Labedella phragmitis]
MRAVVQDHYGDVDVLRVDERPVPEPGAGEVLVRVGAAGLNMADWHLMTGKPYLARLALGLRRPRATTRGEDVAGTVEAVGEGIDRFAVGDRVFGSASAAFAEFVVARADRLVRTPAAVDDRVAAASPMAGFTALHALRVASIDAPVGDVRVLVTGAGGGVGGFVVQYASARGAHVTAVCSAAKADAARAFGAHEVVDYASRDITQGPETWDVVIDFAGARPVSAWRRVLAPGGHLVLGGGEGGNPIVGPLDRALPGALATLTRAARVTTLLATTNLPDLERIAADLESGVLRPLVARAYGLDEVPLAIEDLRGAVHPGKLVVVP